MWRWVCLESGQFLKANQGQSKLIAVKNACECDFAQGWVIRLENLGGCGIALVGAVQSRWIKVDQGRCSGGSGMAAGLVHPPKAPLASARAVFRGPARWRKFVQAGRLNRLARKAPAATSTSTAASAGGTPTLPGTPTTRPSSLGGNPAKSDSRPMIESARHAQGHKGPSPIWV